VTTRFITLAGIVIGLACLSAPFATAGWAPPGVAGSFDGRSPDTKDAALVAHRLNRVPSIAEVVSARPPLNGIGYDGRSPDTKDAGLAAHQGSRATYGVAVGYASPPPDGTTFDGRSPDTRDAAYAAHHNSPTAAIASTNTTRPNAATLDGRSPDTKDAALAANNPAATVVVASTGGFDWTDAGIGAVAGFGLATITAAAVALARSRQTFAAS
jgi:hypothetical protein